MKTQEFTNRARQNISDDPTSRIPPEIETLRHDPEATFDTHCHLMDKQCLTRSFFLLRLIGDIDVESGKIDDLIEFLIDREKDNQIDDVIQIINNPDMEGVLDQYTSFSPQKTKLIYAVLMMDIEYGLKLKPTKTMSSQVVELIGLAKKKPVLPFLAIDPRRADETTPENLYELFLKCFRSP